MTESDAKARLKADVYRALKLFQDALRTYRKEAGEPALFLISGPAPAIPKEQLEGTRVFPRRDDIIADLPKGGIGVEVGTQTGAFARKLFDLAEPTKLYLLDLDYTPFKRARLEEELERGQIELREGVSWELLDKFDDNYFDFAYIDAGHSYEMVKKDLEAALRKVKPGGYIICNDLVTWSPLEAAPYGVNLAVTEAIVSHKLPVTHFAFHPYGYSDIAFRKIS